MQSSENSQNPMRLRGRQVHLDFHTGPAIADVGSDFDAVHFARTLKESHVDSITLFAKCHHGMLYYETNRPERHPGLKAGLDLLGEQILACRRVGIRTPIYLSVMCDEYAANLHPGWLALNPDGTRVGRKPLGNEWSSWQILDMSSPYADYLAEQIEEVVKRYSPVDCIFLDMCWDQISVSNWAKEGMRTRGLNPMVESDRTKYATLVTREYMARYNSLIQAANGGKATSVFYNSRPKTQLAQEVQFLKHIEIEALPTGGWGYTYFPLNVRWARNFGLPYLGMTARFHKSWSDFGGYKPAAALKYEVSQMLAHAAGCSIGDQLHPRGTLDAEAYLRIGGAYQHVEAVEQWCVGAAPVTEVAVLRDSSGSYYTAPGDPLEGVVRLLQQLGMQFDFLPADADLQKYKVAVVMNSVGLTEKNSKDLISFTQAGGKVILAGPDVVASASPRLRELAGVASMQSGTPGIKAVYFRYDRSLIADAERSDVVCYDGTQWLTSTPDALLPATIIEPYFERSWDHFCGHGQTPPVTCTSFGPLTLGAVAAAFGFDIFKAFAEHGQEHVRRILRFVLGQLLPRPLVQSNLPSHAEVTLTQQSGRTIVHILSYAPQRRTPSLDIVEEATPLVNRRISVRLDNPPTRVTRQPTNQPMDFEYLDGYASVFLTSDAGHDLIVLEAPV